MFMCLTGAATFIGTSTQPGKYAAVVVPRTTLMALVSDIVLPRIPYTLQPLRESHVLRSLEKGGKCGRLEKCVVEAWKCDTSAPCWNHVPAVPHDMAREHEDYSIHVTTVLFCLHYRGYYLYNCPSQYCSYHTITVWCTVRGPSATGAEEHRALCQGQPRPCLLRGISSRQDGASAARRRIRTWDHTL